MEYLTPEDYKKAEENGIQRMTVYNRFYQYGWTKERATTQPPYRPGKDDHPRRKYPKKYYEQAAKNGIKPDTFRDRMQKGMSLEEASTKPLKKDRHKFPDSIKEKCKQHGVLFQTFRNRVLRGWDMEEAATRPPMTKGEAGTLGLKSRWEKQKVGGN